MIDPKTQKKYPLNTDDHSLTDKELLVFHRSGEDDKLLSLGPGRKKQNRPAVVSSSSSMFPNDQHSLSGQTMSTASALTEAEHYGGKMYGSCHMPVTCALIPETREEYEMTVRGNEEEREGIAISSPTTNTVLSPWAALSSSLASPLNKIPLSPLSTAMQSFFPKAKDDVRCKRIGMVIFPQYFGSSGLEKKGYDCGIGSGLNGERDGDGTLMGVRFRQNPIDFMAHVRSVERGSLAERMGVEKGDVVTVSSAQSFFILSFQLTPLLLKLTISSSSLPYSLPFLFPT